MNAKQASTLKRGDRIRIKDNAPLDAGKMGRVMCRMSNGIWVCLDDGQNYTIPHREIELVVNEESV